MLRPEQELALAALKLPLEARKALIAELIASLERGDEDGSPEEVAAAWDAEIERRAREYEAGRMATSSWEVVRARLQAGRRSP